MVKGSYFSNLDKGKGIVKEDVEGLKEVAIRLRYVSSSHISHDLKESIYIPWMELNSLETDACLFL